VKLLLDQNLSPRLVAPLAELFPGTTHVRDAGLERASDRSVWEYARLHHYCILSKDADFHQLSFLYGAPPKVPAASGTGGVDGARASLTER